MRTALAIMVAVISFSAFCSVVYAESEMDGSGAAVINGNNPRMYQSVLRIVLSNQSSIARGTFLVYGDDMFLHAYVLPRQWFFSYGNDGSFHGNGPIQTIEGQQYNMTLDGTRIFATTTGSLWKVSADMQGNNTDLILNYFATGTDPIPTVNLSQNATVIIPNGNSAVANKAFYYPLNLEAMRGTTVTWQNEDNIGHVIQSQDGHGDIVSMFNSGLLNTGDTYSYKFVKPGVYYYFCTIHPWRTGVVTIS